MTIPIAANVVQTQTGAATAPSTGSQSQLSAHQHRESGSPGRDAQASDAFQRALHGRPTSTPTSTEGIALPHADSVSGSSQFRTVHLASETSQPVLGPSRVQLGDRILAGLQRDQDQLMSTVDAVAKTSETPASVSSSELLKLQLQVTHDITNESIAGEVGSKVDNDLQTLLKG